MILPRTRVALTTSILMGVAALGASAGPQDGHWWPTQGQWVETQTLVPVEPGDVLPPAFHFGARLAVDGDTLLVSNQALHHKDQWMKCPGTGGSLSHPQYEDGCDWVYVFERSSDGDWIQAAKLVPEEAVTHDSFGWVVDVDEDSGVIVVGNPAAEDMSGTVHVFERLDGGWVETQVIRGESELGGEAHFGFSVAVNGETFAAVGVEGAHPKTLVYQKKDGAWVRTQILDGGAGPHGVALVDDVLVNLKGWYEPHDCNSIMIRLTLQIHKYQNGTWVPTHTLDPQRQFGNKSQTAPTRLALSDDGTSLILGAAADARLFGVHSEQCVSGDPPEPVGPVSFSTMSLGVGAYGSAWIYERVDGEWVMTADIPNPMPSHDLPAFGLAVDIEDDVAVVGVDDPYNGGMRSGAAYLYRNINGGWYLEAKLRNHDSEKFDLFGNAVGIENGEVFIGAWSNGRLGSVHVYRSTLVGSDSAGGPGP